MSDSPRRHPNVVHRDEVPEMPLAKGKHRQGESVDSWDGEPDAQEP